MSLRLLYLIFLQLVNLLVAGSLVGIQGVGAELVIHGGDLRHRSVVILGHDHRPWPCD
ncbi:MAG TPA: hypothetical protein VN748_06630 [Pseudonocardiaceae bacterium]|nr:hypothetical protein [Pseudonocardiaceae bacterium]